MTRIKDINILEVETGDHQCSQSLPVQKHKQT